MNNCAFLYLQFSNIYLIISILCSLDKDVLLTATAFHDLKKKTGELLIVPLFYLQCSKHGFYGIHLSLNQDFTNYIPR